MKPFLVGVFCLTPVFAAGKAPEMRLFLREQCIVNPVETATPTSRSVIGAVAGVLVPNVLQMAIGGVAAALKAAGEDKVEQRSAFEFSSLYRIDSNKHLAPNHSLSCAIAVYGRFGANDGNQPSWAQTDTAAEKLYGAKLISKADDVYLIFEAAVMLGEDRTAAYPLPRHFSVRKTIGAKAVKPSYVATLTIATPNATAGGETVAMSNINLGRVESGATHDGLDEPKYRGNLMPWAAMSEASLAAFKADVEADQATVNKEYTPVTVALTITETADGNKFLAKLGELLETSKEKLSEELANVILPEKRKAAAEAKELEIETLRKAEEDAWISLLEAQSALAAAEAKPETTDAEKKVLDAKVKAAERAWERARRLLTAAGLSAPRNHDTDSAGGRDLLPPGFRLDRPDIQIVGGIASTANTRPWQAALLMNGRQPELERQFCGGSVIAAEWVLTAAHCVAGLDRQSFYVRVGSLELDPRGAGNGTGIRNVTEVLLNRFNPAVFDNDVALLRLSSPVGEADGARPITLAGLENEARLAVTGTRAMVSGWGRTSENGPRSPKLMEVGVDIQDRSRCAAQYEKERPDLRVTDSMLCASAQSKDSCAGDSGGPLFVQGDAGPVLVGVVSKGKGCARTGFDGVYARVANHQAWINAAIGR